MKSTCPKYLQELYGPVTPETWQSWLAFVQLAKDTLSAPTCDWTKARAFYDETGRVHHGMNRHGLHSSSSLTTKRPFPWCGVSMYLQMCCRSISLDFETADSDLRTLAEFRED